MVQFPSFKNLRSNNIGESIDSSSFLDERYVQLYNYLFQETKYDVYGNELKYGSCFDGNDKNILIDIIENLIDRGDVQHVVLIIELFRFLKPRKEKKRRELEGCNSSFCYPGKYCDG